jgi:hypothetical protein
MSQVTPNQHRREPSRETQQLEERREVEAKLLAGLQGPASEMTADEWAASRKRILARSSNPRGEE